MGIQVSVELKDIPESWEVKTENMLVTDHSCPAITGEWGSGCGMCGGSGCYTTQKELRVLFPKSGWMVSYVDDCLLFDNKFVNEQFRQELDENNIPYIRG